MMRLQLDAIHDRGEPLAILWASRGQHLPALRLRAGDHRRRGCRSSARAARSARRATRSGTRALRRARRGEAPAAADPRRSGRRSGPASSAARPPSGMRRCSATRSTGGAGSERLLRRARDRGRRSGWLRPVPRARTTGTTAARSSTVVVTEKLATQPGGRPRPVAVPARHRPDGEARGVERRPPTTRSCRHPRAAAPGLRRSATGCGCASSTSPSALAQRRYAVDGRVVLEVRDEFCPWNDGRWSLAVEGGVPSSSRRRSARSSACDITDLGAAYLGGLTFTLLGDAGRVRELQPGAVARADAMFRTPARSVVPAGLLTAEGRARRQCDERCDWRTFARRSVIGRLAHPVSRVPVDVPPIGVRRSERQCHQRRLAAPTQVAVGAWVTAPSSSAAAGSGCRRR